MTILIMRVQVLQDVPFECKFDCPKPIPWFVIFLLCAGAVGLVLLGRALRNRNNLGQQGDCPNHNVNRNQYGGLRPGEIFGLRRNRLTENTADIQERIYRGKIDTPKTWKSIRVVALSSSVREDLEDWLATSPGGCKGWLFPSERPDMPLSRDNVLYRYIRPRLKPVGLEWVDFQVMRRTHASLMRNLGVDPKVVADLMGYDVNVNLNVYTQTSLESRLQAVETLETAFVN